MDPTTTGTLGPTPTPPAGGRGGVASGQVPPLSDVRLAERALAECWPIPAEDKPLIAANLARIAKDPESSARKSISAARALTQMTVVNLRAFEVANRLQAGIDVDGEPLDELDPAAAEAALRAAAGEGGLVE